jgi:hypothetical protein
VDLGLGHSVHVSTSFRDEWTRLTGRLTASGITIARKVVAGGSDFSDAVAACDPNVKSCKSNREIIKPYMYSYVSSSSYRMSLRFADA